MHEVQGTAVASALAVVFAAVRLELIALACSIVAAVLAWLSFRKVGRLDSDMREFLGRQSADIAGVERNRPDG